MKTTTRLLALACATLGSLASVPALQAADISQSREVPAGSTWNDSVNWGGNTVQAGNNYITGGAFVGQATDFITDGTTWTRTATMRDTTAGSVFAGDALILGSNSRLLGKVQGGFTSTANIVFNGGYFFSGPNGAGSAILAGNLSFGSGIDMGAIALNANTAAGGFTLTVSSTIIGSSEDTLQLTLLTENAALRLGHIILDGDISGFSGTLYMGTANSGAAVGSTYSVLSSSPSATLRLGVTTQNFLYNLATDELFGSLIVGGTTLGFGTYDMDDLNTVAGSPVFTGVGTITVVPEPSAFAMSLLGGALLLVRSRKRS